MQPVSGNTTLRKQNPVVIRQNHHGGNALQNLSLNTFVKALLGTVAEQPSMDGADKRTNFARMEDEGRVEIWFVSYGVNDVKTLSGEKGFRHPDQPQ